MSSAFEKQLKTCNLPLATPNRPVKRFQFRFLELHTMSLIWFCSKVALINACKNINYNQSLHFSPKLRIERCNSMEFSLLLRNSQETNATLIPWKRSHSDRHRCLNKIKIIVIVLVVIVIIVHLFWKRPILSLLVRVRHLPNMMSLHVSLNNEHCWFQLQTKQFHVIINTLSPCLPVPTTLYPYFSPK